MIALPVKMKLILACFCLVFAKVSICEAGGMVDFSYRFEQVKGDYVARSGSYEDIYHTVGVSYTGEHLWLSMALPYVSYRDTFTGTIQFPRRTFTVQFDSTGSGIADLNLGAGWLNIFGLDSSHHAFDLIANAKVAIADSSRGLGTGENDYSLEFDYIRFLQNGSLSASLGYRTNGDTVYETLPDAWYTDLNCTRYFGERWSGAIGYFKSFSDNESDVLEEVTLSTQIILGEYWAIGFAVTEGLVENSPDQSIGIHLSRSYY